LLTASEGSRVVFLDVAKSEADMTDKLNITLSGRCSARIKEFEYDLTQLSVGSRGAKGITVTKYPIRLAKRVMWLGSGR
jgi:topoisomerase-4 subunit A